MNVLKLQSYEMNQNLICRSNGDVLMIYNKENGDMYEINDVGRDIFGYLQKLMPIPEMIETLCQEFDVCPSDIEEDVAEFLQRMIELEVIFVD